MSQDEQPDFGNFDEQPAHRTPEGVREPRPRAPFVLKVLVGLIALATLITIAVTWPDRSSVDSAPGASLATDLARITSISEEACPVDGETTCKRVRFDLLDGDFKGDKGSLLTVGETNDVSVEVGDRIRVAETPQENLDLGGEDIEKWTFADFDRQQPLLWLSILFLVVVLVGGRLAGLRALLGLALSVVVVLLYIVPGLLEGEQSLVIAIAGASAVMFLTIPIAHGWGLTTIAATLGTAASLGITVGLATLFTHLANLTGYGGDEIAYLAANATDVSIQGLLLAGIVIATLGVLDDVTITQASTVLALRRANSSLGFGQLFTRAQQVGRDHITATINTLVLAYAGASLPTLLIFAVVDIPVVQALNGENVASQIIGTLVGSIGLISAVPITTAAAALLATHVPPEELEADLAQGHGHSHGHGHAHG